MPKKLKKGKGKGIRYNAGNISKNSNKINLRVNVMSGGGGGGGGGGAGASSMSYPMPHNFVREESVYSRVHLQHADPHAPRIVEPARPNLQSVILAQEGDRAEVKNIGYAQEALQAYQHDQLLPNRQAGQNQGFLSPVREVEPQMHHRRFDEFAISHPFLATQSSQGATSIPRPAVRVPTVVVPSAEDTVPSAEDAVQLGEFSDNPPLALPAGKPHHQEDTVASARKARAQPDYQKAHENDATKISALRQQLGHPSLTIEQRSRITNELQTVQQRYDRRQAGTRLIPAKSGRLGH